MPNYQMQSVESFPMTGERQLPARGYQAPIYPASGNRSFHYQQPSAQAVKASFNNGQQRQNNVQSIGGWRPHQ